MSFSGKVKWERVITDYHKGVTFYRIEQTEPGFILSGDRQVLTRQGVEMTIFFAAVSHEGRVGKEVEISYFQSGLFGGSTVLYGEDIYVFGDGIGSLYNKIVFEKFTIDDTWFPGLR